MLLDTAALLDVKPKPIQWYGIQHSKQDTPYIDKLDQHDPRVKKYLALHQQWTNLSILNTKCKDLTQDDSFLREYCSFSLTNESTNLMILTVPIYEVIWSISVNYAYQVAMQFLATFLYRRWSLCKRALLLVAIMVYSFTCSRLHLSQMVHTMSMFWNKIHSWTRTRWYLYYLICIMFQKMFLIPLCIIHVPDTIMF